MVKATLRTSAPVVTAEPPGTPAPAGAVVVDAQPIEVLGVQVESRITACPPAEAGLESLIPPAPEVPAETATAEAAQTALVPRTSSEVGHVQNYDPDEDGFDSSDDRFPVLRIVAGSGRLSTMFNVGSVILGTTIEESEKLFGPPDPQAKEKDAKILQFVPLRLKKQWRENLSQEEAEEGQLPRVFNTVEEVEAAGGITKWIGREAPSFKPSATCFLLLKQPQGVESTLFQLPLDGDLWCPAVFYAGNSAYKAFALPIYNSRNTLLQIPVLGPDGQPAKDAKGFVLKRRYFPKFAWNFTVKQTLKKRDEKTFTVFVPDIRVQIRQETGPELRHYVDALMPAATADAEE